MTTVLDGLLLFVALYPVMTAALWVAGGIMFRLLDEGRRWEPPEGCTFPGVTILIPAYNEEAVIARSVDAALLTEYDGPLELLVLNDGSADDTAAVAAAAIGDDPRGRVVDDPVNRGKAARLNYGFRVAMHDLVLVCDADTHLHPHAVRHLVLRISHSGMVAAVAGAPHVTNRHRLICAMQVLEAAAIIGLIRRTQSVTGRVGVVAGILGLFRRDHVLEVGGYDDQMATEDIDLSWRLLMAGWHTAFEPRALVGMEVPSRLKALWAQRKRWARGQGEVIHKHWSTVSRWRNHRMWLLYGESIVSVLWVIGVVASFVLGVLNVVYGKDVGVFGLEVTWGVAIACVATIQLIVALWLSYHYDRWDLRSFTVAAIYPAAYWAISAAAALRSEIPAIFHGPRERRVVWDIPRDAPAETGTVGSAGTAG